MSLARNVHQRGFTLLEILIAVGLVALLSLAVLTVPVWTNDSRELDTQTGRLSDTLTMLSEQSLFSGKLLALRLTDNGWTPLQYKVGERQFVPADGEGLKAQSLPAGLELSWQIDQLPQEDEQTITLAQAAKQMIAQDPFSDHGLLGSRSLGSGKQSGAKQSGAKRNDNGASEPLPQIYFFPSGESTPVTFTLRSRDDPDLQEKRQLTALGRVRDPVHDKVEKAHTVSDLKASGGSGGLFDEDFMNHGSRKGSGSQ